jgi:hypothetical protein
MFEVTVFIVLNCSWVEPFTVWKTLEFTPPDCRPVKSATVPVAKAAPPSTTPMPWAAAPPIKPWITLPRPKLILDKPREGLNSMVDVSVKLIFPMMLEIVFASTSNPEIVETCRTPVLSARVLILVDAVRVLQLIF